ncbi:MAG TPA: N-acetylglucosamine-6-phosphate deacetylase [Firmicutes bacterium]|nr:N-acetylglucosamine-6-phosphate deacetylase [Bacillota bacterium]
MGDTGYVVLRGRVICPDKALEDGYVAFEDGIIQSVGKSSELGRWPAAEYIDFSRPGYTIFPGFIDIHIHGAGYYQAAHGQVAKLARFLARFGVTGFLPTLASATRQEYLEWLHEVKAAMAQVAQVGQVGRDSAGRGRDGRGAEGARILGAHMEGPFINRLSRGGMMEERVREPDLEECEEYVDAAGGAIRLMTLSPELPGAIDLIRYLRSRGIVVSMGHSLAGPEVVAAAVGAGASHCCHIFNNCPYDNLRKEPGVRRPGIDEAALVNPGVTVEAIADGIHVDPLMLELALRSKGLSGMVLITDALPGAGLDDGIYEMPDGRVIKTRKGDGIRLKDTGALVGSGLTLPLAMRNFMQWMGLRDWEAAQLVSGNPARVLGEADSGFIEPGKRADFAVLDKDFNCVMTIVGGEIVYERG